MALNIKHKWILVLVTLLTAFATLAPMTASANICEQGDTGCTPIPITTTPPAAPKQTDTTACTDDGTCSDCGDSSVAGCVSDTPDAATTCSASNCDFIAKYINPTIELLTGAVGLVAVVSIIFGGIQYATSGGDPQKTAAAKGRIGKTILALVAYFFLFGLLQFIVPGGIVNR